MQHIPGKPFSRKILRTSRHQWTRARIVKAAAEAQQRGNALEASRLWALIGNDEKPISSNQRQRRKFNRQRHAAGIKNAFAN